MITGFYGLIEDSLTKTSIDVPSGKKKTTDGE